MVNPINDSTNIKSIDSDSSLKTKTQETNEFITENTYSQIGLYFSNTSKQLEAIKASFNDLSEVNKSRVLHFKTEIALGNYEINNDKIALKMCNLDE